MALTGAILGDIAGSRFEFSKEQFLDTSSIQLFTDDCFFTDDTVLSLATKYAVINSVPFAEAYRDFAKRYPNAGYGAMFWEWVNSDDPKPYHSFGNGSAMRISYIAEHCLRNNASLLKYASLTRESVECTHDHPQAIQGALAVSFAIGMIHSISKSNDTADAMIEDTKNEFKKSMYSLFPYRFDTPLDQLRPTSKYDVTCEGSVPLALRCVYESTSYEDCIRNVLSMRCDRDTVACIAGGIAEALYGATGFDDDALMRRYLDPFLYEVWKG